MTLFLIYHGVLSAHLRLMFLDTRDFTYPSLRHFSMREMLFLNSKNRGNIVM